MDSLKKSSTTSSMKSRLRIVFDTNALISAAILPNSVSNEALTIAVEHFDILTSKEAWQEFDTRVQKPKLFHYFGTVPKRDDVVSFVNQALIHIQVQSTVLDCADTDDNKFLALALDGDASILVTGDQDLLVLHPWRNVHIMRSGEFVRAFNEAGDAQSLVDHLKLAAGQLSHVDAKVDPEFKTAV